jgi:hypothetical protein
LWDATDRTRGLLWGGDPLCRQVREGTGAEAPRHPLRRFPGTFTGHPPCSVCKVRDLGIETREMPTIPYSAGILGTTYQGKAVGATSCLWRLPAMHLVSTPDPNPGRDPRQRCRYLLKARQNSEHIIGGRSAHPFDGWHVAPALLAAACCTTVVKRFLAASME